MNSSEECYGDLLHLVDGCSTGQRRLIALIGLNGEIIKYHSSPMQSDDMPVVYSIAPRIDEAVEVVPSMYRVDVSDYGYIYLFDIFNFPSDGRIISGVLLARNLENRLRTMDIQSRNYAGVL